MITFCLSTYNNLEYLKLCIKSIRENSFYKDAPFVVHAENCTDGTNEWLTENKERYSLDVYVEPFMNPARGIGGGMNFCADKVKTEYIIFLQSDFYVTTNFDLELINEIKKHDTRTVVSSWRIQPNVFNDRERPGTIFVPLDVFGAYSSDFKELALLEWAQTFTELNDIQIRRAEGAGGYIVRKVDWDYIGGNDSLFAPLSYEDMDLFIRMQLEGYNFVQTTKSVIWHFAGRGSHRLEENGGRSSNRQQMAETKNRLSWMQKWGQLPQFDQYDFVKPIHNNTTKTKLTYDINSNTSY